MMMKGKNDHEKDVAFTRYVNKILSRLVNFKGGRNTINYNL